VSGNRNIVILDRDGVINYDSDAYIKTPEEWQPIPGSLEAIARLCAAGYRVAVVSNQSGIGRGLLDRETLDRIHGKMVAGVEAAGGELAGIYFCPHRPDEDCECRKPRTALLRQLKSDLGLATLRGVPVIGDKLADLDLAAAAGARGLLVLTGKGADTAMLAPIGTEIYADLAAAADDLLRENGG
jgi:D-glycero-D-manno-heptose 1,7-bisphosphate phosphatase